MPLKVRAFDGTKWNGYGRFSDIDPDQPPDPFVLRTTQPLWYGTGDVRNNVGCKYGVTRSNYSGSVNFSSGPVTLSDLNISSRLVVTGAGHRFNNCRFTYSYPITPTNVGNGGIVHCSAADVSDFRLDFCEIEPDTCGDRYNGVYGHDFTLYRCVITRTVDGIGAYTAAQGGETVRNLNAHVEGCWIGWLSWYADDTSGGTRNSGGHTSAPLGTHNDGIQWGAGYYLYAIGNTWNMAKHNPLNPANCVVNADQTYTLAAGNGVTPLAETTDTNAMTNPQCGQVLLGSHAVGLVDYVWFEDNWVLNGDNGFKVTSLADYLGSGTRRQVRNTSVLRNKYSGRWRDQGGAYHSYPLRVDDNVTVNGAKRAAGTYTDAAGNAWGTTPPPQYFAGLAIYDRVDAASAVAP